MPETIKYLKECIEVDEVKQALQKNENVQIIDVRSQEEFEQAHIPTAINIDLTQLKERSTNFDKDYQFVTVCGKGGGRSADGARLLKELGYNVIWLCGGTNKWLNENR
jgi:rhodanese-related sulfurtransferase